MTTPARGDRCPCCDAPGGESFYRVDDVPTETVALFRTREDALAVPRATVELLSCARCGFIWNPWYEVSYESKPLPREDAQGCSGTFSAFERDVAEGLIERHGLRDTTVLEIGCGKGEFLSLLCELGGNRGIGVDPAWEPGRVASDALTFFPERFDGSHVTPETRLIACKMTLEHIAVPARFVEGIRRAMPRDDVVVFIQVPDMTRILDEGAFWDVYYDHCSYFTQGSLGRLFRRAGFAVTRLETTYGGQYLWLEARAANGSGGSGVPECDGDDDGDDDSDVDSLRTRAAAFGANQRARVDRWRAALRDAHAHGERTVLWGSGAKAVGFLGAVGAVDEIDRIVDINPHRAGTFSAGTGQEIVTPERLRVDPPHNVVIMNPIYRAEIERDLAGLGLTPRVATVVEPGFAR